MNTMPLANDPNVQTNGWYVLVASDLVWGPFNEDGERREIEEFYVRLENDRGDRYHSKRSFDNAEAAERCIPAVRARLAAGQSPVESAHWFASYPVYGSQAYAEQESEMVAAEKAVDEAGTYYDGGTHGTTYGRPTWG